MLLAAEHVNGHLGLPKWVNISQELIVDGSNYTTAKIISQECWHVKKISREECCTLHKIPVPSHRSRQPSEMDVEKKARFS
jgi:hypothetical protein